MATGTITIDEIRKQRADAKASGKAIYFWDDKLTGFGCRVAPSGVVSWLVQKHKGLRGANKPRIVIGRNPPMTVDQARTQASIDIGHVSKGDDIGKLKKLENEKAFAIQQSGALKDVFDTYYKKKRFKAERHREEVKRLFERDVIPALGKTVIAKVTKSNIRSLIETKEETAPSMANSLFRNMRPFFNWCVRRDLIAVSPMASLAAPDRSDSRERILNEKEIIAYWNACEQIGWPFGLFGKLLLLTGQRREEVGGMLKSELDLDKRTWTISKRTGNKNRKEHVVYISNQALTVLKAVLESESKYVFTTTLRTPISGYSKANSRMDALMTKELGKEPEHWQFHDLRRTVRSGMAALDIPPHICEHVINHISARSSLERTYDRHKYAEPIKNALTDWGDYIEKLITPSEQPSNVVPYKARA